MAEREMNPEGKEGVELNISISHERELEKVAQALGEVGREGMWVPVFLEGDMGAGKTTLVRRVVKYLEGGEGAEVSSPSFNVYNIYPTIPPLIHVDLYRCSYLPDEVLSLLGEEGGWVFLEWCDRLDLEFWPTDVLWIKIWMEEGEGRRFCFRARGEKAQHVLELISIPLSRELG